MVEHHLSGRLRIIRHHSNLQDIFLHSTGRPKSCIYSNLIRLIFILYLSFLNCDWLLIREVQWFYWTQKLLVPAEKFTVRMPKVRLELATPGLQTQCSSHWAIQLKSYCWEGVEFIQLVYCIILYLSFLDCDWLLIREVQWFYWTQKLLVPVEKFIVRMPKVRLELATPGLQTQCSSHWAIQLKSYKMMQCTNWINSTPSQQQLLSCIAQWLEHWVCNPGVASSSLTFGILTVNFSTGTRSFCVQ